MAFDALPVDVQNLLEVQIDFIIKILILVCAIGYFSYNIWVKDRTQTTPYFLVAFASAVEYYVSKFLIFIAPLTLLLLYPQVGASLFIQWMSIFYIVAFFVGGVIVLVNILFFSPALLLKAGGYDPLSERTNKVLEDLKIFVRDIPMFRKKDGIAKKFIKWGEMLKE